jgi:hypothetical protein
MDNKKFMNKLNKITILTLPIPDGPNYFVYKLWLLVRFFKYLLRGKLPPIYSGHFSVTRSLVEGAKKRGLQVNYNPKKKADVADIVHVIGGIKPLSQMIIWKRKGYIKFLSCGPNIAVRSIEYNSILASKEIDLLVNHSKWACDLWAYDYPELINRTCCWAAGVDTNFWQPFGEKKSKNILIFDKRRKEDDPFRINEYVQYLKDLGWEVNILTRSANTRYTLSHFRSLLQNTILMIGFTVGSESQGIAWTEAWAANVPTFILQQEENEYQGLKYNCSTAPFLTQSTGIFFNNFEDFRQKFSQWELGQFSFSPRQWVLNNMSDEICAENLYNILLNQKN